MLARARLQEVWSQKEPIIPKTTLSSRNWFLIKLGSDVSTVCYFNVTVSRAKSLDNIHEQSHQTMSMDKVTTDNARGKVTIDNTRGKVSIRQCPWAK